MQIEASTTVQRPVDEVFAVLSDWMNSSKWISSTQSVSKTSEGPVGVGTTYHTTAKMLGRQAQADLEVTGFEADRRYAFSITTPFPATITWAFESVDGGTHIVQTIDGEPEGFFKLAKPLVETMMKRQVQNDLDTFRDLMDAKAL